MGRSEWLLRRCRVLAVSPGPSVAWPWTSASGLWAPSRSVRLWVHAGSWGRVDVEPGVGAGLVLGVLEQCGPWEGGVPPGRGHPPLAAAA